MNAQTRREVIAGPAGALECAIDEPTGGRQPRGVAVIAHPHPLHGGTLDNKVVQTLARAFVQEGWRSVRFNFRGVGASQGQWDEGRGEVDDAQAVCAAWADPQAPLALAGFSFGAYVSTRLRERLSRPVDPLILVGVAASRFDCAPVPEHTLVIHGETDDVVPLVEVLDWLRPQSVPVTVVPGTGHFFHGRLPLLKSIVIDGLRARRAAGTA